MSKRKLIWTENAKQEFKNAIKYIRQDSEQNADKVRKKILDKINQLSDDKIAHRKDPYKRNNDGSILYFEILKHRIAYRVQADKVSIIRVCHTGIEPKYY